MSLILNFLILLSTVSCDQELNTLDNNDFIISYPTGLKLDDTGKDGVLFILSTAKDGINDNFIENINLASQYVGDISFEDFIVKTEKEIKSVAELLETKQIRVNGRDCLSLKIKVKQNNLDLTFIQHYYIKNQKVYVLTFSSESKMYDSFFEDMNKTLLSFKLK